MRIVHNSRTRLLFVLSIVLTFIIIAEWLLPIRMEIDLVANTNVLDVELPTLASSTYVPAQRDDFAVILERPLFFDDRKLPPKSTAEPAARPSPLRLKLEGVAIVAATKVAVLRNLEDNQLLQLTEGMSHNGWNLVFVTPDSAAFERGGQVSELSLEPASSGGRRR